MENQNKASGIKVLGWILGGALVVSTALACIVIYQARANQDTLTVTGSTKKPVVSDQVKWGMQITRNSTAGTLAGGATLLQKDAGLVKDFLMKNGVTADQITIAPPMTNEIWQQDTNAEKRYGMSQQITVTSPDVVKMGELAKNTQPLLSQGVLFTTSYFSYNYTKLADMRVSMLADAVADAKARASEIAKAGGKKVGSLKSASSGVVQLLAVGSTDVSDGGSYNTAEINKEVMVTVKAVFGVK